MTLFTKAMIGEPVEAPVDRRLEDEPLPEEARRGRDACERQEEEGERKRRRRVPLAEAREVVVASRPRAPAPAEDERAEGARRSRPCTRAGRRGRSRRASRGSRIIAMTPTSDVARVRDARVREHALDRLLPAGDEVRDRHGEHRERRQDGRPAARPRRPRRVAEGEHQHAQQHRESRRPSPPTAMNVVAGVGAPSYASGVHAWNGTALTLKTMPTSTSTAPTTSSGLCAAPAVQPPRRSRRGPCAPWPVEEREAVEQHRRGERRRAGST